MPDTSRPFDAAARPTCDAAASPRHRWAALGFVTALLVVVAACGSTASNADPSADTTATKARTDDCRVDTGHLDAPDAATVKGTIRVLAASSLTEAFADLAEAFSEQYPDAKADVSFGASSELVARIHQGVPADVLATADAATMDLAVEPPDGADADVETPVTLTCNQMAIITEKGNPLGLTGPGGLGSHDVRFVLCAPEVPCGAAARTVLRNAGVTAEPVGSEANVKAVVAKVAAGEADAGVVYVTDADAADDQVAKVQIPATQNVSTTYRIAVTRDADEPEVADAFVAFATSSDGQKILRDHGFGRT